MSITTDFEQLKNKYSGFMEPVFSLSVLPKSERDKFIVTDLYVELTCGYSANTAMFSVYNVYDKVKRRFDDSKINEIFQVGKPINIEVGYSEKTECVFRGFISGITYKFSDKEMPHIDVECLDVMSIMMTNNNNTQILQDSYSACIREIVNKSQYKPYYRTADIDSDIKSPEGEDKQLIEMVNESDYEFIVKLAKRLGYEFFVSQETLYFRKSRSKKEPIMKISNKDLIVSLEAEYNINGVVDSVEVRNVDNRTGDVLKFTAKSSAVYSDSSSASKIIQNAQKVIVDPSVSSYDEAKARAQVECERLSWNFGNLRLGILGTPEFTPGRFVGIVDVSKNVNKTWYINKITHIVNKEGYKTFVEAQLNSL